MKLILFNLLLPNKLCYREFVKYVLSLQTLQIEQIMPALGTIVKGGDLSMPYSCNTHTLSAQPLAHLPLLGHSLACYFGLYQSTHHNLFGISVLAELVFVQLLHACAEGAYRTLSRPVVNIYLVLTRACTTPSTSLSLFVSLFS